ncbi:rhomboid family intramembrane serine protease [bacterium]|nr:rhomboid family intramembrane serine protease [bacterium]
MRNENANSQRISGKALQQALVIPLFTVLVMALLKFVEVFGHHNFVFLGIVPRTPRGLVGIVTGPLIHGNLEHLVNNSVSLFLFGTALFYFYRRIAIKVWLLLYFATSALVWLFARGGVSHIGISGVIYALAFFLFFGGVLRKNRRLAVVSLLLTLFYGSMVWGVLPFDPRISWESHLFGALVGLFLSIYFRNAKAGIEHFDQPSELPTDYPDLIGDQWKTEGDTIDFRIIREEELDGKQHDSSETNSTQGGFYQVNYIIKPSAGKDDKAT